MRRKSVEELEIPMAAMIDVVFLLLIFFIVTHQDPNYEAHVAINLPSPSETESDEPPPQTLEIHVSHVPGEYYIRGEKADITHLIERLEQYARYDTEQTVVIKVSQQATHEYLMMLLDGCKKAGLSNLNVLTLK